MATLPHLTHPDNYASWMEHEAMQAFIDDQVRWPRDRRVPCAYPECSSLTTTIYCSGRCRHLDDAMTLPHYADETGRVLLGLRSLADQQRATDDAAGGLIALACGRR